MEKQVCKFPLRPSPFISYFTSFECVLICFSDLVRALFWRSQKIFLLSYLDHGSLMYLWEVPRDILIEIYKAMFLLLNLEVDWEWLWFTEGGDFWWNKICGVLQNLECIKTSFVALVGTRSFAKEPEFLTFPWISCNSWWISGTNQQTNGFLRGFKENELRLSQKFHFQR